jgi:3-oxoacyl-[acyl-carrier-protein] synthase-3
MLGADGSGGKLLMQPAGGSVHPASLETVAARQHVIQMEGRQVFRFATRVMPEASRQALELAGLTVEDVHLFVPHQANDRILQTAARGLGVPDERMFSNLARYGNTSSASVPIALCEAIDQGLIHRDDVIVCVGFGAGLTWAASVLRWSLPLPVPAPSRRTTFWRALRYRWARLRSRLRWLWWRLDTRLFRILHDHNGVRKQKGGGEGE